MRKLVYFILFLLGLGFVVTFVTPMLINLTGKWVYFPNDFYLNLVAALWPAIMFAFVPKHNYIIKAFVLAYASSKFIDFSLAVYDYFFSQIGVMITYLLQLTSFTKTGVNNGNL
jgi:hypothetical protein